MIENMVELVGIELTMSLENRQVIEFAYIAQCPECLKILAIPNSSRLRKIPSFFIRKMSVERFPNGVAAPLGQKNPPGLLQCGKDVIPFDFLQSLAAAAILSGAMR